MKYQATIKRMQVWYVDIEADNALEATKKADAFVVNDLPDDEYVFDVRVTETE